jgi:hypothetical protein
MGLPVQVTTVNAPYQAASYTGVLPDESRLGSDRQPAGHKPITGYYLANPLIPLYEWPTIRPEPPAKPFRGLAVLRPSPRESTRGRAF